MSKHDNVAHQVWAERASTVIGANPLAGAIGPRRNLQERTFSVQPQVTSSPLPPLHPVTMDSRLAHQATRSDHEHDIYQGLRAAGALAGPPDGDAQMLSPSFTCPLSEPKRKETKVSRCVLMYVDVS